MNSINYNIKIDPIESDNRSFYSESGANLFTGIASEDIKNYTLVTVTEKDGEYYIKEARSIRDYMFNVIAYVFTPQFSSEDTIPQETPCRCRRATVSIHMD